MKKLLILTVLIALGLAGYFSTQKQKMENTVEPLRIGINPWPGYELLYLGYELGFFDKYNIKVEMVEMGSLSDIRRAFSRNQIDVMTGTLFEVVESQAIDGQEPKIFMFPDFSNGGDVIVAKNNATSVRDLVGKKVGVEKSSLGFFILKRALEQAGLDIDSVEIVPLEQSYMKKAMAENLIDASVSYPPFSSEMERDDNIRRVFDTSMIPAEVIDVFVARSNVMKTRKKDLEAIARVWDEAVDYYMENPKDAIVRMASHLGMTQEETEESINSMHILKTKEQKALIASKTIENTLEVVKEVALKNYTNTQKVWVSKDYIEKSILNEIN